MWFLESICLTETVQTIVVNYSIPQKFVQNLYNIFQKQYNSFQQLAISCRKPLAIRRRLELSGSNCSYRKYGNSRVKVGPK